MWTCIGFGFEQEEITALDQDPIALAVVRMLRLFFGCIRTRSLGLGLGLRLLCLGIARLLRLSLRRFGWSCMSFGHTPSLLPEKWIKKHLRKSIDYKIIQILVWDSFIVRCLLILLLTYELSILRSPYRKTVSYKSSSIELLVLQLIFHDIGHIHVYWILLKFIFFIMNYIDIFKLSVAIIRKCKWIESGQFSREEYDIYRH